MFTPKRPRMNSTDSAVSDADRELYLQNVLDINASRGLFYWYNNMWGKLTYDSWPSRLRYDVWPRFLHYENQKTVEISVEGGPFHRYNIVSNDPSLWKRLPDDLWQRFLHYLSTEEMSGMGDTFRWYSNMWKQLPDALWTRFIHDEYRNTVEMRIVGGNVSRYNKVQFNEDPSLWEKLPDDLWLRFLHYLNTLGFSEIKMVETIRWETNCMWGKLPDELWLRILGHLDKVDICLVGATSRRFNRMSKDTKLWEKIEFDMEMINSSLEAVKSVMERATTLKEMKFTNKKMEDVEDMAVASLIVMAKETLKILIFSPEVKLENEAVLRFECLAKLEVLDFSYYTLNNSGVKAISKLKKLRELKIPILDEDLRSWKDSIMLEIEQEIDLTPLFKELRNLEVVDLTYIPITDATLSLLAKNNPNLEHLNITSCSIRDRDWPSLQDLAQHCPKLWNLDLTGHITMSSDSFNALAQCKNLQHLVLEHCFDLSDGTLQNIAKNCTKLRHVNLEYCKRVKDGGVKALAQNCPNLQFLNLEGNKTLSKDVIVEVMMACKQLTEVHICKSRKISRKFLERITKKYPDIEIYGLY